LPDPKPPIDRILHALGDPTRREMIERLSERPMSVSALAGPFDMTLTAVVQHLRLLEDCGLVRTEKLGRVRTCSVDREGLAVLQRWLSDRRSAWERGLDRLGEMLEEDDGGG
jgi:DNA-binding transcriptional ArsR family regulator